MELETAVERLYTDESLAADVDDKTAAPLLKWAENILPALIARGDEGFDEAFVTLKKLIKSVARLIDMRGEIDMAERAERAERIQGFAQELGIEVNIDHLESLVSFDGPELVAQIVGGATASASPPLPPHQPPKPRRQALTLNDPHSRQTNSSHRWSAIPGCQSSRAPAIHRSSPARRRILWKCGQGGVKHPRYHPRHQRSLYGHPKTRRKPCHMSNPLPQTKNPLY
jgi:hypothetical protein